MKTACTSTAEVKLTRTLDSSFLCSEIRLICSLAVGFVSGYAGDVATVFVSHMTFNDVRFDSETKDMPYSLKSQKVVTSVSVAFFQFQFHI